MHYHSLSLQPLEPHFIDGDTETLRGYDMFKVKQLVRYELMQSDSKAHTFNLHGMLPRDDGNELGRGVFKNDLGQCSAVQYVSR